VLREVASSPLRILILAAVSVAGIACGSAPTAGSSLSAASPPVITIPSEERALPLAPTESLAASARPAPAIAAPITWITSEQDARDRARKQGLPLLVYVRAEWAVPCIELERRTWLDPRVAAAARPFVALRLDVTEAEGNAELYAQRYGVSGVPEILVVDLTGHTVARNVGAPSTEALVTLLRDASGE
jgi:thiol:disulfide interchange protein DsbD